MSVSVVIMAGGKGERFWPKSRKAVPKQFIKLTDNGTMLQLTFARAQKMVVAQNIYIVTGQEYAELVAKQLPDLPYENIIVEPEGRNTAPCIGLSAVILEKVDPDTVMVVLPADHYIADEDKFIETLQLGVKAASEKEAFVTLGIIPTRPETGYGYIEIGDKQEINSSTVYEVDSFKEKPDYETAQKYLSSGRYYWNSGMFIWTVSSLLKAVELHQPELHHGLNQLRLGLERGDFNETLSSVYKTLPKESIDYAILEKIEGMLVIPGQFGWDDVGSWAALSRLFEVDDKGNFIEGSVIAVDTQNSIIESKTKLIAAVGVEDLVVIDSDDAILICPKDRSQDVKLILDKLRKSNLEKYL